MDCMLKVRGLSKKYPSFELKDISFSAEKGKITGFIGRNGAGKSTTLNSLFNIVHPDSGNIEFFGKSFSKAETEIKQRTGFVSSGINYYPKQKIKNITKVTRSFYEKWNDEAYFKYIEKFSISEKKTPDELSAGMKVKYALALALSHNAELLVLDEPTSGLDPVSRDDLLDDLMDLCDEGKSILFSTHITSDLDKCADKIIYIKDGEILAEETVDEFRDRYRLAIFPRGSLTAEQEKLMIGKKRRRDGMSALVLSENAEKAGLPLKEADLESIMVHLEKEG